MKKELLPLNETICVLTFHRLFEFSDYIVAIETFQLSLCLSWRCCNKLDIIWVSALWCSFSYLECMSNIAHGNLAWKTAVLWPMFNTHAKQWHLYNWCKLVSSAVNVYIYHAAPMSASVLFVCFGFPVHSLSQKCWNQVLSGWCLLFFSTFTESEKRVLQVSPSSALHNHHETSIIIYMLV